MRKLCTCLVLAIFDHPGDETFYKTLMKAFEARAAADAAKKATGEVVFRFGLAGRRGPEIGAFVPRMWYHAARVILSF